MEEAKFKDIVAQNITEYRKAIGMTQFELANKLNYSDKSVSKWERAEAVPDAFVLTKLAALFGVTVDVLISENAIKRNKPKRLRLNRKVMIPAISVLLTFFVATLVYGFLIIFSAPINDKWMCFIFGILVSSIVLTVFSYLWFRTKARILFTSALTWSVALTLFLLIGLDNTFLFFIIAGAFQLMIIFWFLLKHARK
jgi:transcriptional regulator with XRE-family HTH domain